MAEQKRVWQNGESAGLGVRKHWVQVLPLTLIVCVTMGESLKLSVPTITKDLQTCAHTDSVPFCIDAFT